MSRNYPQNEENEENEERTEVMASGTNEKEANIKTIMLRKKMMFIVQKLIVERKNVT